MGLVEVVVKVFLLASMGWLPLSRPFFDALRHTYTQVKQYLQVDTIQKYHVDQGHIWKSHS